MKKAYIPVLVVWALLIVSACNPNSRKLTEGTVIVQWIGEPTSLHPANEATQPGFWIESLMHSYLITGDIINQTLRPDLAKALPTVSDDGLEYEYELREGVFFDDGSELSVNDVIFSYKAAACPLVNNPNKRVYLAYLKDIVPDPSNPLKFKMIMTEKYILNLYIPANFPILEQKFFDPDNVLSKYSFAELTDTNLVKNPPEDLKKWADSFNDPKRGKDPAFMNGLGPYKLDKWEEKQTLVLKRKDKFWQMNLKNPDEHHRAYPSEIIFKYLTDDNAINLELKKQEIDVTTTLSTRGLIDLQKDEEFNKNFFSDFIDSYSFNYIALNSKPDGVQQKKIFDDIRVRKAVALMVPVQDIINTVYYGKATVMNGPVTPSKPEVNPDLQTITVDPVKAAALLDEAGWKDTDGDNIRDKVIDGKKTDFTISIMYGKGNPIVAEVVKIISESLYKIGIKLEGDEVDGKVYIDRLGYGQFDMALGALSDSFEPADFNQIWHTKSQNGSGMNYSGFGNAESDALIDSISVEVNEEKRVEMSHRLQKMIVDAQTWVFMFSPKRKIAISKKFENGAGYATRPNILLGNLKPVENAGK